MKTIIAGSRDLIYPGLIPIAVGLSDFSVTEVVSGTAKGPDQNGEAWARTNNIPIKYFPADWNKYGRSAGHKRNSEMGKYADQAIVLWDGKSRGSEGMINVMKKLGKPCFVFMVDWKKYGYGNSIFDEC